MPSTNVCKKNKTRAANDAKAQAEGKVSTSESRKTIEANQNALKCVTCLQGYPATAGRKALQSHMDAKHPKAAKIEDLFPAWVEK